MLIDLFLFLGLAFLATFIIGIFLEKIKVPWVFAALFVGSILSVYNPFKEITSSSSFEFLAGLGMYFLLFIIGFELDLENLNKNKTFIFKTTFFIIFLEAFLGALLVHFVFKYSFLISLLVSLSFATVGEAILIPILDRFKMINTKLGQSIIGIGTFDDIIEILLLLLVIILVGTTTTNNFNLVSTIISLGVLAILTFGLIRFKKKNSKFRFLSIESLFFFVLLVLFLFLGIGELAHVAPIVALVAGIVIKRFIPKIRVSEIRTEVRSLCYGFFAPIFFLWVGVTTDIRYLASYPLLILLVVGVSSASKLLGSWLIGKKELGAKKSILLGVGLSVRFSTSIIVIKILFDNGIIGKELYSVIIASTIILTFLVPVIFSRLIIKWKISGKQTTIKKHHKKKG